MFLISVVVSIFVVGDSVADCSAGRTQIPDLVTSFVAPVNGRCGLPNYTLKTLPDLFDFTYNGIVSGSEITLCNNGHMVDGECVSYDSSGCDTNGYVKILENSKIVAPVGNGCKLANYRYTTLQNLFEFKYNGILVGSEITLCNNGYMSGGACVSYATGDCDTGNYDMGITNSRVSVQTAASCPSSYRIRTNDIPICTGTPGNICVLYETTCSAGQYLSAGALECSVCPQNNYCAGGTYTYDGTDIGKIQCPSNLLAPNGMWELAQCGRKLNLGDKYIYLRSVKKTTPSLNFDINQDGVPDFFGNATKTPVPINADFSNLSENNQLVVEIPNDVTNGDGTIIEQGTYYIYDDTVSIGEE